MVTYDFDDRVVFVTGAARGQGRSHALGFANHGANVVVTDLRTRSSGAETGSVEDTVEEIERRGGTALSIELDVTDEAGVRAAVERAIDRFGRIDVLANNAGIAPVSGLLDLDEATWDRTLAVDLKGMWLCAKHVGRHMRERGGSGRIVNTASTAALASSPGLGHYSAAKHGVVGLTKTLAVELAGDDVTVNAVCPTAVDTPMTGDIVEEMDEELGAVAELTQPDTLFDEILQPEDVTALFLWLASDEARYVTGVAIPVAAGATAV